MTLTTPNLLTLTHLALVGFSLFAYVSLSRQGRERRSPSAAVGWVVALLGFPWIALPLFLLLGNRKRRDVAAVQWPAHTQVDLDTRLRWLQALRQPLQLPPVRQCAQLQLLGDGAQALAALLTTVQQAQSRLDVCLFIYQEDASGAQLTDAISAACARGVHVRVLLDYVGNLHHALRMQQRLLSAGADARVFGRPRGLRSLSVGNQRNHRKLVLADGQTLWSGGRNVGDDYFERDADTGWWDLSYLAVGGISADAQALFDRDFAASPAHANAHAAQPAPVSAVLTNNPIPNAHAVIHAMLLPSGPDFHHDGAYDVLLTAIFRARTRIWAATPYFVPNDAFLRALTLACQRGVDVCLLLPAKSNHALADIARKRSLRELHAAGGRIVLQPRMNHAKAVLVDDDFASCGSLNLDGRSLFINYEVSALAFDAEQIRALHDWFLLRCQASHAYQPDSPSWWQDVGEGMVRAVAFQL